MAPPLSVITGCPVFRGRADEEHRGASIILAGAAIAVSLSATRPPARLCLQRSACHKGGAVRAMSRCVSSARRSPRVFRTHQCAAASHLRPPTSKSGTRTSRNRRSFRRPSWNSPTPIVARHRSMRQSRHRPKSPLFQKVEQQFGVPGSRYRGVLRWRPTLGGFMGKSATNQVGDPLAYGLPAALTVPHPTI